MNRRVHHHPREGQIEFRLLCSATSVGGLIGPGGSIIKRLQTETSSKIYVDVSVSSSLPDRLVHVIGGYVFSRRIGDAKVSDAQVALLKVFERLLEAEEEAGGGGGDGCRIVKCRLVLKPWLAGAVLGVGGKRITRAVMETKANISVLPLESPPPPSVSRDDEIVLISGSSSAVKKALVIVSRYIQQKAMLLESELPDASVSQAWDPSIKMKTQNSWVKKTLNGGVVAEVIFKLVCPYHLAGYVIGHKGILVKALQEETGAYIHVSAADGFNDRVVTVSASEKKESQTSFAQNAVVRIFNDMVERDEVDPVTDIVTARLVILSYQCDWLNDGEVSVISSINNATGATLKILKLDYAISGVSADEKILQIDGECPNVQIALFQVTWCLRDRFFDSLIPKNNVPLLPHKLLNMPPQQNEISALTDTMNNCTVSEEINGSLPAMSPHSKFPAGRCLTTRTTESGDLATAKTGSDYGSVNKSVIITKTKLEVAVREDVFGAVYGENGSNLDRLRLISGATVEVHDPCNGSEGKLIISGTRDQTLVAQSLLQAFLMSAQ